MASGYFVTGTDTHIGKTRVSCALLQAFAASGRSVVGMKPVVAGCEDGRWADVDLLTAASTVSAPADSVNPYAFVPPVSPHIAAIQAGIEIDLAVIQHAYRRLQTLADVVIVEGVGGFRVPLSEQYDGADLARRLGLPVILVVGLRLGCLNHALLSAQAIQASGLLLAGWVANGIDPHMSVQEENIRTLQQRLDCPLLGRLPFDENMGASCAASRLDITRLAATTGQLRE